MSISPRFPFPGSRNAILGHFNAALRDLNATQQLVLFGVLVGFVSGVAAFVFDRLILLAARVSLVPLMDAAPGWRALGFLAFPALGAFLGALLIMRFCPEWKGHGVHEVLRAIREKDGRIEGTVAWVKSAASALTIGFGGSAGREGPVVQIGAAAGSWVGQRLRVPREELKVLAAAGASAGLAAAFGIPLTAVFFTMEVVLRDFASESFAGVVIASVTAVATARFMLGGDRFMLPLSYDWHGAEGFLVYVSLGLVCAPLGSLYTRCLGAAEAWTEKWFRRAWLAPAAGGLVVGLLALGYPQVMGTGQSSINEALHGGLSGPRAGALALVKIAATTATLGTGGSGGALMPSLFIGAMAGTTWGGLLGSVFHLAGASGAFALVGMACVLTAAYQAPVTGMILALEISQDYEILLPVMFACIVAYLTTRRRFPAAMIEN